MLPTIRFKFIKELQYNKPIINSNPFNYVYHDIAGSYVLFPYTGLGFNIINIFDESSYIFCPIDYEVANNTILYGTPYHYYLDSDILLEWNKDVCNLIENDSTT